MESFTAEFLPTTKNRPSLVVNGYQHRLHRKTANAISWVCTKQKKDRCRGCVKTDLNNKVISMTPHCCATNVEEIELKKTLANLKKRVRENIHSSVPEIFKEELRNRFLDKFSEKPQYSSIKTTLNRVRRKVLRRKLNSWLPEESDCLLPNKTPRQVECVVDYNPSQLMEEKHCPDVEVIDTNLTLQIQKRTQYSPGKRKPNSSDNSPEHIECLVDFHPSQFSVDVEVNRCQDGQITDANKNNETQRKQFLPGEKFIKSENSHDHSEVYQPNQLVEQKNEENNCRIVQVVDEHVNKKRKLNSQEEQIEDLCSLSLPDTTRKDEFHVFGDYVASELRKLSPRALVLAKHNINNILFEANIGNYDSPSTSSS